MRKRIRCKNEASGCWCELVHLDHTALQYLDSNFENCLCPECLKSYERTAPSAEILPQC